MAGDPKANGLDRDSNALQTAYQQTLWKRWDELNAKAARELGGLNLDEINELFRLRNALGLQEKRLLF